MKKNKIGSSSFLTNWLIYVNFKFISELKNDLCYFYSTPQIVYYVPVLTHNVIYVNTE